MMARESTNQRTEAVLQIIKDNPGADAATIHEKMGLTAVTRSQIDRAISHLKTMGQIQNAKGYGYQVSKA